MLKWTFSSIILCVHLDCFFQLHAEKWNGWFKGWRVLEPLVWIFQKNSVPILPSSSGLAWLCDSLNSNRQTDFRAPSCSLQMSHQQSCKVDHPSPHKRGCEAPRGWGVQRCKARDKACWHWKPFHRVCPACLPPTPQQQPVPFCFHQYLSLGFHFRGATRAEQGLPVHSLRFGMSGSASLLWGPSSFDWQAISL